MKTVPTRIVAALTVFACFGWPGALAQTPIASQPDVRVGDSWEYQYRDTRYIHPGCTYSLTVERVTGTRIYARIELPAGCGVGLTGTMPVKSGSIQTYSREFNHFYYSKTPYRLLSFPLSVGKTWSETYEYKIGPWTYSAALEAEVVGFEPITVAAGTFEAFKILVRRKYQGTAAGRWTQSGRTTDEVWYAPSQNNLIKRTYSDIGPDARPSPIQRELVKYIAQPRTLSPSASAPHVR